MTLPQPKKRFAHAEQIHILIGYVPLIMMYNLGSTHCMMNIMNSTQYCIQPISELGGSASQLHTPEKSQDSNKDNEML